MRTADSVILRRLGVKVEVLTAYMCADRIEAIELEGELRKSLLESLDENYPGFFEARDGSLWESDGNTED